MAATLTSLTIGISAPIDKKSCLRRASQVGSTHRSIQLGAVSLSKTRQLPRSGFPKHRTALRVVSNANGAVVDNESEWYWKGEDDFTHLDDRKNLPPLPLPEITERKRIVLVRHGQSTWNAAGRMQGASDFGVLTSKGEDQAMATRKLLMDDEFEALFRSPLQRASKTADIIWRDRIGPTYDLPGLREVDLYSFQGLLKNEMSGTYPEEYKTYRNKPAEFEIDGHYPIRELWHRASLNWQRILTDKYAMTSLVVAHNAINRAMIGTALGLPPSSFTTFAQANAAVSVVDFTPRPGGGPPHATLDRMNSSTEPLFDPAPAGQVQRDDDGIATEASTRTARVVLVRCGATDSTEDGLLLGTADERINTLGRVQARKTAEVLLDVEVGRLVSSESSRCIATANEIAELRVLIGEERPQVEQWPELRNLDMGDWEGLPATELIGTDLPPNAESLQGMWERAEKGWARVLQAADESGTVVVVGHAAMHGAMLCQCLGLPVEAFSNFHLDPGSVTVLEFPHGAAHGPPVLQCTNHTAHMGRWAVPATVNLMAAGCGLDGCFI